MAGEPIEAARRGDRQAFEALLRPLVEPAYRMALAMLSDREAAEDAVQEGSLRAWRAVRSLRPDPGFRPWFLAIVANQCRDTRRRRWWSVLKFAEMPPASGDPSANFAARHDLRQAIDRLSRADRMVLYLFFGLDLPLPEVGQTLGISAAAAKSRLYRITRRLRPELEMSEVHP